MAGPQGAGYPWGMRALSRALWFLWCPFLVVSGCANPGEVDFVVPPGPRAAESKYVDALSGRDTRALATTFGRGLLLTRSAIDLHAPIPALPAALFAWLLDQKG